MLAFFEQTEGLIVQSSDEARHFHFNIAVNKQIFSWKASASTKNAVKFPIRNFMKSCVLNVIFVAMKYPYDTT